MTEKMFFRRMEGFSNPVLHGVGDPPQGGGWGGVGGTASTASFTGGQVIAKTTAKRDRIFIFIFLYK